jgi:tetratricopeptide (TPR) repeat protein
MDAFYGLSELSMYVSQGRNQIGIKCPECGSLNVELLNYEEYRCRDFHFNLKSQNFRITNDNRPSTREGTPPTAVSGSASLTVVYSPLQTHSSNDTNEAKNVTEPFRKPINLDNCKSFLVEEIKKIHNAYQQIQYLLDNSSTQISDDLQNQIIDDSVWNLPGLFFFNRGNFSLSEMVYSCMLNIINKINPSAHKGLALYQVGISQINNGNFDEGIPYILQAYEEDIKNQPLKATNLPASETGKKILDYVSDLINTNYYPKLKTDLPTYFGKLSLAALLSKLSFDEQLFLVRLILGWKRLVHRKDTFTKIVMFNNLLNVYVLIETFLGKGPNPGTLGDLIRITFSNESWFSIYKTFTGQIKYNPSSLTYYDDYNVNPQYPYYSQLQRITSKTFSTNHEENFIIRMFLSSHLTRNYLAHRFNPTSQILTTATEYDRLLDLAVMQLLYCLR